MRKSFWIVLALLVASSAPVAHADSFSVAFTCTGCTGAAPTAGDVTFPSPTLDIMFEGADFSITLPSNFAPGDSYSWFSKGFVGDGFSITDGTLGVPVGVIVPFPPSATGGAGTVTFSSVSAPEPSSLALLPLGFGALLAMRKRPNHKVA